jgi:hypothetical protein
MDPVRDEQFAEFLDNDLLAMGAEDEMDLVRSGIDLIEQTLEINGAAGAGSGDDEFHGFSICRETVWGFTIKDSPPSASGA